MSKIIAQTSKFHKPSFRAELGEEGLTAHEIAESLGVPIDSVHKKLKRGSWHSGKVQDWRETTYVVANEINGLSYESFILNVPSAKAFVARYVCEKSDTYLEFLFKCEQLALSEVPRLRQEIALLKRIKPKKQRLWKVMRAPKSTLDGFPNDPVPTLVSEDNLSPDELKTVKLEHSLATARGISQALAETATSEQRMQFAWEIMRMIFNDKSK